MAGAAIALASCGSPASHPGTGSALKPPTPRKAGAPIHWIIAASSLGKVKGVAGAAFITAHFDSSGNYVVVGATPPRYLASWNANIVVDARSLADLGQALSSRPGFVLFDIEDWRFTPVSEAADPAGTLARAAADVSSTSSRLIAAPALDLAKLIGGKGPLQSKFLAAGIPGAAAKGAWGVDIQAQSLEGEPGVYSSFVKAAAAQIEAANPAARVFAGLSTNPSGRRVTAAELASDVAATRSTVYGYWLNVPSGGAACPSCGAAQPEILVQLLDSLG